MSNEMIVRMFKLNGGMKNIVTAADKPTGVSTYGMKGIAPDLTEEQIADRLPKFANRIKWYGKGADMFSEDMEVVYAPWRSPEQLRQLARGLADAEFLELVPELSQRNYTVLRIPGTVQAYSSSQAHVEDPTRPNGLRDGWTVEMGTIVSNPVLGARLNIKSEHPIVRAVRSITRNDYYMFFKNNQKWNDIRRKTHVSWSKTAYTQFNVASVLLTGGEIRVRVPYTEEKDILRFKAQVLTFLLEWYQQQLRVIAGLDEKEPEQEAPTPEPTPEPAHSAPSDEDAPPVEDNEPEYEDA